MKRIFFSALIILAFSRSALAQTCPDSITSAPALKSSLLGWKTESNVQTYYLTDLTIISGPLGPGASGFESTLKPMNKNNTNFWKLSIAENDETWMRCSYQGTSLSIARRLNSDIVECFQRNERMPKDPKRPKVVAMCVDTTYKGRIE